MIDYHGMFESILPLILSFFLSFFFFLFSQDPNDKKVIVCDEKLKKLFGKERVGFLEITKLLNPHFKK